MQQKKCLHHIKPPLVILKEILLCSINVDFSKNEEKQKNYSKRLTLLHPHSSTVNAAPLKDHQSHSHSDSEFHYHW